MTMNWLEHHSIIILGYKRGLESHLESKRLNTVKYVRISLKANPLKTNKCKLIKRTKSTHNFEIN